MARIPLGAATIDFQYHSFCHSALGGKGKAERTILFFL